MQKTLWFSLYAFSKSINFDIPIEIYAAYFDGSKGTKVVEMHYTFLLILSKLLRKDSW